MAIQSISFKSPPPTDRTGNPVAEGSAIPKKRGRKNMTDKEMVEELDGVMETLSQCPCSFWACDGPKKPRWMQTCNKCWAMVSLAKVIASLKIRK